MTVVRPIQEADFSELKKLTSLGMSGLTTLPNDDGYLKLKINESLRAFDPRVTKPGSESYLFVLEQGGCVIGVCGILAKVGGFEPFYTYKIKTEHHSDQALKVQKDVKVLHLCSDHSGPSEICSLFILPEQRKGGLGRFLSLSRLLFMAEFSHRFEQDVISEMRGYMDESGKSPFWEHVGRHFFETEFTHADYLSGLGRKGFIKNLMPKYPIYITLLPPEVQRIIGKVHKNSEPALALLRSEGFMHTDEVDIFDAGPTVMAKLTNLRSVRESEKLPVKEIGAVAGDMDYLVCNASLDFRVCLAKIKKTKEGVCLDKNTAASLNVKVGECVRFVTLR